MPSNNKISDVITDMATERGVDKTICPSEVAKALFKSNWRKSMPEVRTTAVELHKAGKVVITQKGEIIDPDQIKGPIRIRIV